MDVTTETRLACTGVGVRAGGSWLVRDVSVELRRGEVLALVGPNGAGKSTLLSVLTGDRRPTAGRATLHGRDLAHWKHDDLARERAVMLQHHAVAFGFSVREVVAMGRHPWPSTSEDAAIVAHAMARLDISHLADRSFPTLSGGEQARAVLARCLAQRVQFLALDEPTAALDLRHQEDVLRLVREHAADGGSAVLVLHDLTLAAAYADRIAVMDRGGLAACGSPREVLTPEVIESVYGLAVSVQDGADGLLVVPRRSRR